MNIEHASFGSRQPKPNKYPEIIRDVTMLFYAIEPREEKKIKRHA